MLAAPLQVRQAAWQVEQISGLVEARNWLDAQLVAQMLPLGVVPEGQELKHWAL